MSVDTRVWYYVHLGLTIAAAVVVAIAVVLLVVDSNLLLMNSFQGPIILLFVMPGALLVYTLNHLILWRRKPRTIRTGDKVVLVIFTVLVIAVLASSQDIEIGLGLEFFLVPLLVVAGVVSTIVLAIGSARLDVAAQPAPPIEPGTTPVAATLDQLFSEQPAAELPAATPTAGPAETPPPTTGTPYGPKD